MADSADTIPASPSSRSQRVIDNAKRNPFTASLAGAVPLLALLPALFEHLEKIQRINSALGYQVGTFAAIGLLVLGAYHKHRSQESAERADRSDLRIEALVAALEREGARNRAEQAAGYIDLKNQQAATQKAVDAIAAGVDGIRKDLAEITGPQRRPANLYGMPR